MNKRLFRILTLSAGLIFLSLSLLILFVDLRQFRSLPFTYPQGTTINAVPIGGLSREQAGQRLAQVFDLPLELQYGTARMQFAPADLGFKPDIPGTLDNLAQSLRGSSYWQHLWHTQPQTAGADFTLATSLDVSKTSDLLTSQVSPRYDQPPTAPLPIVGTTNFEPGLEGTSLQIEPALPLITAGLNSPAQRIVSLPVQTQSPAPLNIANLETLLMQEIAAERFEGVVEIFLHDLAGDRNLHFAVSDNRSIPPDIAFSAASTIKIPIMASTLARTDTPTSDTVQNLLERMIIYSENPPADRLMSSYIDETRGPLIVTQDMAELGYQNTFLAGYFYFGAPVLQLFTTPANSRTDINLDPDVYNQSVTSELGDLLSELYTCANLGPQSSKLANVFADNLNQDECINILDLLSRNKIGLLIEGGMPPAASVAHKHGWTSELDGLLHTMSDAAVVSTPGGDFVLVMFIYSPRQLIFQDGNWLFARLSQSIYNAFNIDDQTYWWIE